MIDRILERFARFTAESRGMVTLFLLAMTLVAALLVPKFEFESDISRLLPADNPVVQLGRTVEAQTGNTCQMILDLRAPDIAEKLPEIIAALRASPYLDRVTATRKEFLGDIEDVLREAPLYFLPEQVLDSLDARMTGAGRRRALEEAAERLAADPVAGLEVVRRDPLGLRWVLEEGATAALPMRLEPGTPYLILNDGARAVVRVRGREVPYQLEFTEQLLDDVHDRLAAFDVDARLHGDYPQARVDSLRVRRDLRNSALASLILVGLFLAISMRRLFDPILVFFPVLLAIFWALPIGGALLGPMTALTISAAAILIGLGVDFTIHYLVRYSAERQNAEHGDAVKATLAGIGRPLLGGMLTTVAAFLSLSIADFSGLRVFGLLLALGLGFAFISAVLSMPLVLGLRSRVKRVLPRSPVVHMLETLALSRAGKGTAAVLLFLSFAGLITASLRKVEFASDLAFFRPANDAYVQEELRFEEELGFALMPVALFVEPDVPGATISKAIERLRDDGDIGLAIGNHITHPTESRRSQVANFRRRVEGWVEGTLADLDALDFNSEPFREGLEDFAKAFAADPTPREDLFRISLATGDYQFVLCHPRRNVESMEEWRRFKSALEKAFGTEVKTFHVQMLLEEVHRVLLDDLVKAALITAALAAVLVSILSGGIRTGALAMLPTVCGFGITLGTLSIFRIPLNMGNCVAIPFLLGIGVDHGVHLVAHFRRTGGNRAGSCGVAIWRSSVTTILGFGSLITAQTPGIASMGLISILGVVSCLVTSLLVVPVLWPWALGTKSNNDAGDTYTPPETSLEP